MWKCVEQKSVKRRKDFQPSYAPLAEASSTSEFVHEVIFDAVADKLVLRTWERIKDKN